MLSIQEMQEKDEIAHEKQEKQEKTFFLVMFQGSSDKKVTFTLLKTLDEIPCYTKYTVLSRKATYHDKSLAEHVIKCHDRF